MLFHLRHYLRVGQSASGRDLNGALRKRLGSAETFLQFQLGLTRPDDQKCVGQNQLTDNVVVVPVKLLAVALLVFLLASSTLLARKRGCAPTADSKVLVVT